MNKKREKEKFDDRFSEISSVENVHDTIIPEEFPEGAFGSPIKNDAKVENKSTEWEDGQHSASAFTYPDKERHDDLPRQTPGAHPLHDE